MPAPVPVIEVNRANWDELRGQVLKAIETASYVAVDLELSGIGQSRDLNVGDLERRYDNLRRVADTRAVLSLGLSCVRFLYSHPTGDEGGGGENWTFLAQNFDVLCACEDEYTIDPRAVKFLVDHGFDFNRQMALGLPYRRGRPLVAPEPNKQKHSDGHNDAKKRRENDDHDQKQENGTVARGAVDKAEVRDLVLTLIRRSIPVVCHNGFVDVVFLYRHFVSPVLPPTLRKFGVDMHALFSCQSTRGQGGGAAIYDTKYVSEFVARMSVTYLVYLFRKFVETNEEKRNKGKNHVTVVFPPYPDKWEHLDLMEDEDEDEEQQEEEDEGNDHVAGKEAAGVADENRVEVCVQYALHGCCRIDDCSKSHDIDDVFAWEKNGGGLSASGRKRRKRKAADVDDKVSDTNDHATASQANERKEQRTEKETAKAKANKKRGREAHRAGYDAYMTAHLFACMACTFAKPGLPVKPASFRPADVGLAHLANKVYLTGKKSPLLLEGSAFERASPCVNEIKRSLGLEA